MLKDLNLGKRIGLGFGVLLLLLVAVSSSGVTALNTAEDGVNRYRQLANRTNLISNIQVDLLMVRMHVKGYLVTQSEDDLSRYHEYLDDMQKNLGQAKEHFTSPDRAEMVRQLINSTSEYETGVDELVRLFDKQHEIYTNLLIPSGSQMRKSLDELLVIAKRDDDADLVFYLGEVMQTMAFGRLAASKFLNSGDQAAYERALRRVGDEMAKELEVIKPRIFLAEGKRLLAALDQARLGYGSSLTQIHTLMDQRSALLDGKLYQVGAELVKEIDQIQSLVMAEQRELGPQVSQTSQDNIKLTLVIAVLAIILTIVIAYVLTVSITRPIQTAVEAANQLAEGDLTIDVGETSNNETGALLRAVQNTATNLSQMVATISATDRELNRAAADLNGATEQSSAGSVKQVSETEMVATAMNEMAATVHDVAGSAVKAADAAGLANTEAASGVQVVEDTIVSINSLSDSVNDSSEKMAELQQQVINIVSILEAIRGIADQTNLLALNAAIEAARAGEYGRGFAVVADEVRELAGRTQASTAEIQTIIEQLQSGTENAVQVMDYGKTQADNCVEQAKKANQAIDAISQAINVINDMNLQIASAAEEQSSVAESINESVLSVKYVAEDNSSIAERTAVSSNEVAQLAEQLNQMVRKFKV